MVIAEQGLHRGKAFSASCTSSPVRGLGVHNELGGDTAGTADPNWPQGIVQTIWHHAEYVKQGEEERRGDLWSDCICLLKSLLCVMEPCSPEDG